MKEQNIITVFKKLMKKLKKKVNNVQVFQMPEMNYPFYTTPEFLGIAFD